MVSVKNLLLLCALFSVAMSAAQEREFRAIEVELGAGLTCGASRLGSAGFDNNRIGETGFVEVRYNFNQAPVDLGFHAGGTIFGRTMRPAGEKLNFSSGNFLITSDYNCRFVYPEWLTLFAGLGVGYATFGNSAQIRYQGDGVYTDNGPGGSLCVMPRIGVELWHHLRITCAYVIEERANRHFAVTLGVAIGGGRRNKALPLVEVRRK